MVELAPGEDRAPAGYASCFEIDGGNTDNRDRCQGFQMRIVFALLIVGLSLPVAAQAPGDRSLPTERPAANKGSGAKTPPLQPIPEPPPPPPGLELDPALEPEVTIQRRGAETVEEFRVNGQLYMVKVTPAHGVPYYLIDDVGRGYFVQRDNYDTRTRPPMWVIHQF
jgi:Protein of unknown function (DUF2782)